MATSDDEAGSLDSFVVEDHDSGSEASDPGVSDDDDAPSPVVPPPPRPRRAPILDAPGSDDDGDAPPAASQPQYAEAETGEVASEDESAGSLDDFIEDSASSDDEVPVAAAPKARRRVVPDDY